MRSALPERTPLTPEEAARRRAHRLDQKRRYMAALRRTGERTGRWTCTHRETAAEPPDPAAIAEADRVLAAGYRSLSAMVFGDPLIGRSALERRQ